MMYSDLSVIAEKAIDIKFFLDKISKNGYQTLVVDY